MPYKILDLFAGAGGLSLGFELVRDGSGKQVFELYRTVEIDRCACETLRNRYGSDKVIEGDLTKSEIHERIIDECKGKVSIVMGGIPCQSFSLIGPRSGFGRAMEQFKQDERDNLYIEFRKIVAEIDPNIIIIENVKGILSKKDVNGNKIIDKLISDFEKLGYTFENDNGQKYLVLNAADFGVPQKRERVILIGILKKWKDIKVPLIKTTHYDPDIGVGTKAEVLLPYVTLFEAIGDLSNVNPKITFTGLSKRKISEVKKINEGINSGAERIDYDMENFRMHLNRISDSGNQFLHFVRPNGYMYLDHHIARRQQLSDIELFKNMHEGETAADFENRQPHLAKKLIKYKMNTFKDKYRKQRWDKPSTTVFAHLEKDGNRFIHPRQARTLTPRETARIQSFPDDFVFSGPLCKKFRQIGNAVPPLMSKNLAENLIGLLQ